MGAAVPNWGDVAPGNRWTCPQTFVVVETGGGALQASITRPG